ncbi:MAG TPA: diacylglycerol kinase family protein, partial [Opitutaceae bacterium]|nr:diacylglycerol kinase family protein [Opitutaceae bacterium]
MNVSPLSSLPAATSTGPGKLRFICNLHSGRGGRNARLLPRLRAFIGARGLDADLAVTEGRGHATELAREAARLGCARVVAVGGDGTVNEVAQALLHTPAALAIVPSGSGNGLARYLRVPAAPFAALELAVGPRSRAVLLDAGTAAGLPFFNAMGIGLDAEISRRFNQLTRRGLPAYLRTGLAAFFGRQSERVRITAESRAEEVEALIVAVANSDQYGNGAIVAPGARADDGVLDLIAVGPVGTAAAVLLAARLFLGTFDRSPAVRRLRSPRFQLRRPGPGLLHTDGEVHHAAAEIEIAVQPR